MLPVLPSTLASITPNPTLALTLTSALTALALALTLLPGWSAPHLATPRGRNNRADYPEGALSEGPSATETTATKTATETVIWTETTPNPNP